MQNVADIGFLGCWMMTLIKNWLLPIPWVHGADNNIALKGGALP
jgi:hypothetical protein